jgi:hypothetical protein
MRRLDSFKLAKIKVADRLQRFGSIALLQMIRQCLQVSITFSLYRHQNCNGIPPALGATALTGSTTVSDWRFGCYCWIILLRHFRRHSIVRSATNDADLAAAP